MTDLVVRMRADLDLAPGDAVELRMEGTLSRVVAGGRIAIVRTSPTEQRWVHLDLVEEALRPLADGWKARALAAEHKLAALGTPLGRLRRP